LDNDLWLKGAYCIEIDQPGQLRIVGPHNHLHYGAVGLYHRELSVRAVSEQSGELTLHLELNPPGGFLPDPAMGHIRGVRELIQIVGQNERTFEDVRRWHPHDLMPSEATSDGHAVTYTRRFGPHSYGTRFEFPPGYRLTRDDERRGFQIEGELPVAVICTPFSNPPAKPYSGPLLQPYEPDLSRTDPRLQKFFRELIARTDAEYEHLVRYNKTSGFDYGTVFPRDWMEAADLGAQDLEPDAIKYMYTTALRHVNDGGAGWHEEVIGEFKYQRERELDALARDFHELIGPPQTYGTHLSSQMYGIRDFLGELFVSRMMIDIEPHYILGLQLIPIADFDAASLERLRRVAAFVLSQAESRDLITFNKLAPHLRRHSGDEYYGAGNWRDSEWGYKRVHPVIAPYDVNAVFYPQALKLIRAHHAVLEVDRDRVERLISKWSRVKDRYRFDNPDGLPTYALALYNVRTEDHELRYDMLKVNHLDEAYDLFYGDPTEAEVTSFTTRVLSPDYFFTASGPILVGHGENFTTAHYHGKVSWAKQTAYAVAGLERQLERARRDHWLDETVSLLQHAVTETSRTSLQAFARLGAIPELHYDDAGTPRFYSDQPEPEGQMNKVQLWSTAGARRILRTYLRNI
jgi:hypothetical protein